MKELELEIITPSKSAYKGPVKSVTLPGTLGNFQVLFNHAPLLSSLEIGRIKIELGDEKKVEYVTGGGTVEVNENKVLVLADSFESSEEIDVDRARQSYLRAKERLALKSRGNVDETRAQASLHRAINRMKFKGINV